MTKPATLSVEAYPPGSVLFVWDAKEVRRVRVVEILVTTQDPAMRTGARHLLEPADEVPDPLAAGEIKPLYWNQVNLWQLHADAESAKAAQGN